MIQRYRLLFVILAILIVLALMFVRIEYEVETEYVELIAVNPDYLQLYSLSKTPDDDHTVMITDQEERIWYRETEPFLDLGHCNPTEAYAMPSLKGKYGVLITVDRPFRQDFSEWCRNHQGRDIGAVIKKNRLIYLGKMVADISSMFLIEFSSREEAERVANEIRAGGIDDEASSQPTM